MMPWNGTCCHPGSSFLLNVSSFLDQKNISSLAQVKEDLRTLVLLILDQSNVWQDTILCQFKWVYVMKTHNPKAGAPRQPLNHLLMRPCARKQGSPGLRGAVAAVHIGAKAAADRTCPVPRRKCCLTSSRSKINQSAPLMINRIFQFQLQPVTLFKVNRVATVKQWFGKLIKPCGRTTKSVNTVKLLK